METTAVSITTADGRHLRYGPDEPNADGIPFAITYSSTIPGGHDTATFNLRTRITDELPFSLLDDVRIYGPGNRTLWEGMVAKLPRQSGDDFLVNVQGVGHSAQLKWDTGFREIYIDRDLSHWGEASLQRRADLGAVGHTAGGWAVVATRDPGSERTGISHTTTRLNSTAGGHERAESWYDAHGIPVGFLYYDLLPNPVPPADANWITQAYFSTDDLATAFQAGTDHNATAPGGVFFGLANSGTYKYLLLLSAYVAVFTGDGKWEHIWRDLGVFGYRTSYLPLQGTGTTSGYHGHDVLFDIVTNAAPGLAVTGIEQNTSFNIPQLVFFDPVSAEDAILEVNKYFLWEWGVFDNREFFWRPGDPDRLTWEGRIDQGLHMALEGDDSDTVVNGVIVTYSLPDGVDRTVGPLGSGLQTENAALGDTSAANPVNAHGIARKYAKLDVSSVTTDAGAIAIGAAYLAQLSLPARKGSMTLTGTVTHPTKGERPVSEVRAGDWIRVTDLTGTTDIPRRIIQASHTPDSRECQVDVGNDIDKVDAILQRVGIQTQLVGG